MSSLLASAATAEPPQGIQSATPTPRTAASRILVHAESRGLVHAAAGLPPVQRGREIDRWLNEDVHRNDDVGVASKRMALPPRPQTDQTTREPSSSLCVERGGTEPRRARGGGGATAALQRSGRPVDVATTHLT